jgi:hypothetical protein
MSELVHHPLGGSVLANEPPAAHLRRIFHILVFIADSDRSIIAI